MNTLEQLIKDLSSNSKKKSNNAGCNLSALVRIHLDKLEKISSKYNKSWKEHSQYISGKGSLYYEDIYNNTLNFRYTDYWQYGGKCDEVISINTIDLEKFNYEEYELNLRNKIVRELTTEIIGLELTLEDRKKKLHLLNEIIL